MNIQRGKKKKKNAVRYNAGFGVTCSDSRRRFQRLICEYVAGDTILDFVRAFSVTRNSFDIVKLVEAFTFLLSCPADGSNSEVYGVDVDTPFFVLEQFHHPHNCYAVQRKALNMECHCSVCANKRFLLSLHGKSLFITSSA